MKKCGDKMILLDAIQGVLSVIIIIGIGYILSYKGWFDESTSKLFSKMVVNISLPLYMISNLMNTFSKESLSQAGIGIIVPFISMIICYLISIFIAKFINVKPERKGTFQCMFFLSNTIFIGLPINLALFGEKSIIYVLYYYFSNTILFWTLGVYIIKKDTKIDNKSIFSINTLKSIFTPPLIGFVIAIILILLNISLPKFVMDTCKYIGNLTTPLSMLFIGIVIYSINLKNFKFDKDVFWVLIGRFLVAPLITYIFSLVFSLPSLMKNVFVIQASLPVMANTAIVTKEYDADYEYAAMMIAVTTIASLIFIPIYRFLLG